MIDATEMAIAAYWRRLISQFLLKFTRGESVQKLIDQDAACPRHIFPADSIKGKALTDNF